MVSLGLKSSEIGIVNKSNPELSDDDERNFFSLNYLDLIAPIVSVEQDLIKRVSALEQQIQNLTSTQKSAII